MKKGSKTIIALIMMTISVIVSIPVTGWLGMNNTVHYISRPYLIWVILFVIISVGHYSKVDGRINKLFRGDDEE